jgi:hypothetical protein
MMSTYLVITFSFTLNLKECWPEFCQILNLRNSIAGSSWNCSFLAALFGVTKAGYFQDPVILGFYGLERKNLWKLTARQQTRLLTW